MKYYLYLLTNTLNNKYYIGVHRTVDPLDDYYGSGTVISRAISKYGKDAFNKSILMESYCVKTIYHAEKITVGDRWKNDRRCYNATAGGAGGWSHVDQRGDNNPMRNPEVVRRQIEQKSLR